MIFDKKIKEEYFWLLNYKNFGQYSRERTILMCMDALDKIDSNNWIIVFDEPDLQNKKNNAKSMIQLEIVSKIMIYIEDLAIISESLLKGENYYKLLDPLDTKRERILNFLGFRKKRDVGRIIEEFFSKMNTLTIEELCKIMSYKIPNNLDFDKECINLLTKMIHSDVEEVRRIFKLIDKFSDEHHPAFRRYKHAGLPFFYRPNLEQDSEFLKKFDFSSVIAVKKQEPFQDMKALPFSNDVKEGYGIMIQSIRKLLLRIIDNRIGCIQRGIDWAIPTTTFSVPLFSMDELKKMKMKSEKYMNDNPPKNLFGNYSLHLNLSGESWYKKLPEFLAECRQIGQLEKEFKEKIDKELNIDKPSPKYHIFLDLFVSESVNLTSSCTCNLHNDLRWSTASCLGILNILPPSVT